MIFFMIFAGTFFLNLFHKFQPVRKSALRTLDSLDLPGMKGQDDILQRKCIDIRGISG
jgi:hypothetical protein